MNACGDYLFANNEQFDSFLSESLGQNDAFYLDLKSKHFISDRNLEDVINFLAIKFRRVNPFFETSHPCT